MDTNVLNIGMLLTILAAAAVGALAASGLTAVGLLMFFRSLLNSPTVLRVVEGLVASFPPDTRELINTIAKFIEVVSENPAVPAAAATGSAGQNQPGIYGTSPAQNSAHA